MNQTKYILDLDRTADAQWSWKSHWLKLLLLSFVVVGLMVHGTSTDPAAPSFTWGVALLLCGVAVAFYGEREFDMFSPIFMFGVSFALQYGIALILPLLVEIEGPYGERIRSIFLHYPLAGLASFMALTGFYVGYANKWIDYKSSSLMCWKPGATGLEVLWVIFFSSGMAAYTISLVSGVYFQVTTDIETPLFYSAVGFFQAGIYFALPLAVGMALNTRVSYWKGAAIISILGMAFFGIPSGSKTLMLLTLMFVALAWNYARHQFSRAQGALALAATLALVFVISPFNIMYRDALSQTGDRDRGMQDAIYELRATLAEVAASDPQALLELSSDYVTTRLSNISVVATVIDYQESGGAIHMGETYLRAIYGFVPRVLWLEKPALSMGSEFAVVLGFGPAEMFQLGKDVSTTSVGITFVGEQVFNFGIYLTFFISAIFGIFYRWLYATFRRGLQSNAEVAIGLYGFIWYVLVFAVHESNFAGVLAGAIKYVIFVLALLSILNFKRVRKAGFAPASRNP